MAEYKPYAGIDRAAYRDRIGEEGRRDALRIRYSTKCSGRFASGRPGSEQHADVPGGCANDGGSCLCPCHDRAEEG